MLNSPEPAAKKKPVPFLLPVEGQERLRQLEKIKKKVELGLELRRGAPVGACSVRFASHSERSPPLGNGSVGSCSSRSRNGATEALLQTVARFAFHSQRSPPLGNCGVSSCSSRSRNGGKKMQEGTLSPFTIWRRNVI